MYNVVWWLWLILYYIFWTVGLQMTLESPLDRKEIKPVNPKGNQPWIFIGRTDAKAPIFWPPDVKSWLISEAPDAGADWGQEEKGTTEDEIVGSHHRLNEHEFGWTPGVGDGQGGLACCGSWGCRVRHDWATELNWIDDHWIILFILSFFHSIYSFIISFSFCSNYIFTG